MKNRMNNDGENFPYDFFVSRRGSAAAVAKEVAEVLESEGYRVVVQDFDFPVGGNFVSAIQDAITKARHFIGLLTEDYAVSPFTKAEWTNFFALATPSAGTRRLIILRIDNVSPPGLLAAIVYGDLWNVTDPATRREIILLAAEGQSTGVRRGLMKFRGVPPSNPDFTGREDLFQLLQRTFNDQEQLEISTHAALHGLGGTGKSSLAIEYAHRSVNEYAGIWWAAAESRTVLIASLAELAAHLDKKLADEPDLEKAATIGLSKLSENTRPWLLVYDNVISPGDIIDLTPARGANLLITTQFADWGGRATEIEVGILDPSNAVKFLIKRAKSDDHEGAALLAEKLDRLPLALDHAGAYVKISEISFARYAELLKVFVARVPAGAKYPDSVAATFELALKRAVSESAHAETLLAYFAALGSDRIPLYLIRGVPLNEVERSDALASLIRVSLIRRDSFPNGISAVSVHRLVQLVMRERTERNGLTVETAELAIAALVQAYPRDEFGKSIDRPRHQQILPHAVFVLKQWNSLNIKSSLLWGLRELINLLQQVAASVDIEEQYRKAITLSKTTFGLENLDTADRYQDLANFLRDQGQHGEAEQYYRISLDISRKVLGSRNVLLSSRMVALAELLNTMGRVQEASPLAKEAYQIYQSKKIATTASCRSKIEALNAWGNALREDGHLAEAEDIFRETIALGDGYLSRKDRYVATCSITWRIL